MEASSNHGRRVRFGAFEADLQAGELRKSGIKVRLQDQPFRVLALLLERSGEVVTREKLRSEIWPDDTFVDFDHSLNTAINKIREALGDSASHPRFVETIPRRGYRFVYPIEKPASVSRDTEPHAEGVARSPELAKPVTPTALGAAAAVGQTAASTPSVVQEQRRSTDTVGPLGAAKRFRFLQVSLIAFLVVSLAAVAYLWSERAAQFTSPDVARTLVELDRPVLDPSRTLEWLNRVALQFSPDGRYIVHRGFDGENYNLYRRPLDQLTGTVVAGTDGAESLFSSPDGEWLGFWAGGELRKVPIGGGPVVKLCDLDSPPYGASWGSDNTVVFGMQNGGLLQVSADGRTPEELTTLDTEKGEVSHRLPAWLPGGEALLFTVRKRTRGSWEDAQIVVQSLRTGERKVLIENGADARYAPSGHLVFARLGTLMAASFDLARLEVTGSPVGVIDGVLQAANLRGSNHDTGATQFSFSENGLLTYLPGGIFPGEEESLVWVDRKGRVEPLAALKRPYGQPRLSPDGRQVAVVSEEDIWLYDITRDTLTRLTVEGHNLFPSWTPDGARVTFGSITSGGVRNLFWRPT